GLTSPGLANRLWGLFYFAEALIIGDWLRRNGAGHLHVHFATPASTVGVLVKRIFGTGLSITVHGPDEFYAVERYRLAEKIQAADFLCCIGAFARSQLMRLSPPSAWDKLEVVPLGVDPTEFAPRPEPPGDRFELLCVGRLVPAKGQHILLAAVAQLVREGRDRLHLRLVGDGPDMASLRRLADDRGLGPCVTFEGAVNQDRVRQLYGQASAFALASFAEGIPVVLMEAMAMEIPCITTFVAGIPELIRSGVDGLLVPPSDTGELAAAIARLMDDRDLGQRLGRQGRQRVLERYDLRRNTQRLAEVFARRLGAG
ncbi:MAG: glycosyltransferase family 4 protein, partial [Gemmatimonadota bacterium]